MTTEVELPNWKRRHFGAPGPFVRLVEVIVALECNLVDGDRHTAGYVGRAAVLFFGAHKTRRTVGLRIGCSWARPFGCGVMFGASSLTQQAVATDGRGVSRGCGRAETGAGCQLNEADDPAGRIRGSCVGPVWSPGTVGVVPATAAFRSDEQGFAYLGGGLAPLAPSVVRGVLLLWAGALAAGLARFGIAVQADPGLVHFEPDAGAVKVWGSILPSGGLRYLRCGGFLIRRARRQENQVAADDARAAVYVAELLQVLGVADAMLPVPAQESRRFRDWWRKFRRRWDCPGGRAM